MRPPKVTTLAHCDVTARGKSTSHENVVGIASSRLLAPGRYEIVLSAQLPGDARWYVGAASRDATTHLEHAADGVTKTIEVRRGGKPVEEGFTLHATLVEHVP